MSHDAPVDAERYLERIGFTRPILSNRETLDELIRLHAANIPFENATSFGQGPTPAGAIELDSILVASKLLGGKRGGYCFEHAKLLQHVLPAYGFPTRCALARVYQDPRHAPSAKTHVVTVTRIGHREFLTDPGYGGLTPTASLSLEELGKPQQTPHGRYRVVAAAAAGIDLGHAPDIDVMVQVELAKGPDSQWVNLYAIDLRGIANIDLPALNWFVSTSPMSMFTQILAVSLAPEGKRITLSNKTIRQREGEEITERAITSTPDLALALDSLGIDLPDQLLSGVASRLQLDRASRDDCVQEADTPDQFGDTFL
ncbi:hypothetical protein AWB85_15465 [Mycobacteroides immunogenum]|uniref:Arylamine N-acetyltransferase n=1 Tax=Mycobacteroides immunogenum TaxID=83262 RepID=A0A179V514_9MYCO|nr:arylamine N-acetyltransferase [Mycobacteroides immunogenum]OAT67008.1 hypothetical protein AWB85_15465 [Mycobacteroides immunogenum]